MVDRHHMKRRWWWDGIGGCCLVWPFTDKMTCRSKRRREGIWSKLLEEDATALELWTCVLEWEGRQHTERPKKLGVRKNWPFPTASRRGLRVSWCRIGLRDETNGYYRRGTGRVVRSSSSVISFLVVDISFVSGPVRSSSSSLSWRISSFSSVHSTPCHTRIICKRPFPVYRRDDDITLLVSVRCLPTLIRLFW